MLICKVSVLFCSVPSLWPPFSGYFIPLFLCGLIGQLWLYLYVVSCDFERWLLDVVFDGCVLVCERKKNPTVNTSYIHIRLLLWFTDSIVLI